VTRTLIETARATSPNPKLINIHCHAFHLTPNFTQSPTVRQPFSSMQDTIPKNKIFRDYLFLGIFKNMKKFSVDTYGDLRKSQKFSAVTKNPDETKKSQEFSANTCATDHNMAPD
jgi:hypothetical protein